MTENKRHNFEDWHILAYLDGELDASSLDLFEDRLKHDKQFRDKVLKIEQTQKKLSLQLQSSYQLSSQDIGEYLLGILSEDRAAIVRHEIRSHPEYALELNVLEQFLAEINDVQESPSITQNAIKSVKILIAQLIVEASPDLFRNPTPSAPALRGKSPTQYIYSVDAFRIILNIQDNIESGSKNLLGLIISDSQVPKLVCSLYKSEVLVDSAEIDHLGNFIFINLESGTYRIVFSNSKANLEVHIPELTI